MTCETHPRTYLATATLVALTLTAALATACSGAASEPTQQGRIQPTYDQATGRLNRLAYDANDNGRHDTWAFMDGTTLIRLEADENEDGAIDRWEYYPAAATGGLKQPPERIERATRFDGRVSRREFFEGGVMTRIEEDTDGNGAIDKWETYRDGVLAVLALDTKGRGTPDRRFVYAADGSLERMEDVK